MIELYSDNTVQLKEDIMGRKVNVGTMVEKTYRNEFHARCIENNTTMSAVVIDGIKKFMEAHPRNDAKYKGI